MKRNRAVAIVTNGVLAFILAVIGVICFFPAAASVSGTESKVYYKGGSENGVSLMFNVYWGTEVVYGILDVLDEYRATATFFIGGCWADDNTECVKEIAARGHEIGSHGYFHLDHSAMNYEENLAEIGRSAEFLNLASGTTVSLFAPPSGAYCEATLSAAEALGLKTVLWSKDTIDWRDKEEDVCFRRATEDVTGGDLVLMHPMEHTLAALPRILSAYAQAGLRTVTVSENIG